MQLKLQRSQRMGGLAGNTVVFCLDVRADYSAEEQNNIRRYKMGSHVIYNSRAARKHFERAQAQNNRVMHGGWGDLAAGWAVGTASFAMAKMSLNISIGSLARGHHIECKDLDELLEAEDTVRNACKGVTRHLEVAATFDGGEMIVEYKDGEEFIHITQNAPPLLVYEQKPSETPQDSSAQTIPNDPNKNLRAAIEAAKRHWLSLEKNILAYTTAKGWKIRSDHVRALGVVVGVVAFFLLLKFG